MAGTFPEKRRSLRELAQAVFDGEAEPAPVAKLLGLRLCGFDSSSGAAQVEMDVDDRHWNPMGTVEGGILSDLADIAMGHAFIGTLQDGESFTTIELKTNFLRPVRQAHLTAKARVVSRGRTIGLVECDVKDENGKLVARSVSTCMVLRETTAEP